MAIAQLEDAHCHNIKVVEFNQIIDKKKSNIDDLTY